MKIFLRIQAAAIVIFILVIGISLAVNKVFYRSKNYAYMGNEAVIDDNIEEESIPVLSSADKDEGGQETDDGNIEDIDNEIQEEDSSESSSQPPESTEEQGITHIGVGPNGEGDAFDAKIVWAKLRGEDYEKPDQKIAFLTFDDGPSEEVTPQILDILKRNNIKATFFVVGSSLSSETSKGLLKRIYEEGNAIGNHTYSHRYDKLYPNGVLDYDNFISEIKATDEAISDALGTDYKTKVIRCPGGFFSWKGMDKLKEYLLNNGMAAVDWNAVNGDAETSVKRTPDELLSRAKETMHGSDLQVILMHDTKDKQNTALMLQLLIDELKAQGYIFKTLV